MTRERLLALMRSVYRLTPQQMARVEEFIVALDPEPSGRQLDAVWLFVEVLRSEARSDRADTAAS
jgi:hypothetical protein